MAKDMTGDVARLLADLHHRVVFAESCTGGLVSATLAQVPGISKRLCGSFVTYRPNSKRRWIGVSKSTINTHTTESQECAIEMAMGALRETREADWSAAIVGHFGPVDSDEKDRDGVVYICIARRTDKGKIKTKDVIEARLSNTDRVKRQREAADLVLTILARNLMNWTKKNQQVKRKQRA